MEKLYFLANIILSLILGYVFIHISLYLCAYKLHPLILIPIFRSILGKHDNTYTIVTNYSGRFIFGVIIGIMHGILIKFGLNIYMIILTYCFYLTSPIELPFGNLYNKALNEENLDLSLIKVRTIQYNLKFINLMGYTISVYSIYHFVNI